MSLPLTLAWRYLRGRRLRTGLTLFAVALAVMITVAMQGILPAVKASFDASMASSAHAVDLVLRRSDGALFDAAVAGSVGAVPGVAALTPVLELPLRLPADLAVATQDGPAIASLVINGVDPAVAEGVIPIRPLEGRWFAAGDERSVLVRASLARATGLGVGDSLRLARDGDPFTIVGVLPERPLAGDEELMLPLGEAQALLGAPGRINAVTGLFAAGADGAAVRAAILARLGPGYTAGSVSAGADTWRTALQLGEWAFGLFGVLAMAMAGFIMLNTFRTSVAERRRDIALLRAVGASRRTLVLLLAAEGLLLGVAGTAAGVAAGAGLVTGLLRGLSSAWERLVGAPLGAAGFGASALAFAVGLGVGVPLLAVLLPALAAGQVSPLVGLREQPEHGAPRSRARLHVGASLLMLGAALLTAPDARLATGGALLVLVALTVLSPLLVRPAAAVIGGWLTLVPGGAGGLAQRNLLRNPGRAAVTASAIMISLAILVALAGLTTTFTRGLMGYLERSMRADYLLLPEALVLGQGGVAAGPGLAERVRAVPGVADVTTLRRSTARAADAEAQIIGVDPEGYARLAGLVFTAGDERRAYARLAEGDAAVVNGILAAQAGVAAGDPLTLDTPNGARTYEVVGVGIDYLNARQATAYVSQAELAAGFGEERDVLVMADRAPGASAELVEAGLRAAVADTPGFSLLVFEQWRAEQLAGNQVRSNILYGLMLLLAIPSLVALANTLGINVLERTRELAVLRALGSTRAQVRRMVVMESLLLAALGVGGGLVAGLGLGYALVRAITQSGLVFPYLFPVEGALLTVAVGLAFGVLAALLPAQRAARMDIVAALRHE